MLMNNYSLNEPEISGYSSITVGFLDCYKPKTWEPMFQHKIDGWLKKVSSFK